MNFSNKFSETYRNTGLNLSYFSPTMQTPKTMGGRASPTAASEAKTINEDAGNILKCIEAPLMYIHQKEACQVSLSLVYIGCRMVAKGYPTGCFFMTSHV